MARQSMRSTQPGLVDTTPRKKAVPKKRPASPSTSEQPEVKKAFKTTKAASKISLSRTGKEAATEAVQKQTRRKTICSVDFGTTYSGVAVVGSMNSAIRDIEVLDNWVGGVPHCEKLPSRIAYAEDNPGLEKVTIGYEVKANMKSYTWMKLLLPGNVAKDNFTVSRLGENTRHGMLELPHGKTAQDVVTDYLRCLYERIMDHLTEETPGEMLAARPIEFWLTTPACWDDRTNNLARNCALKAGFGARAIDETHIMSEPEAALLCNLSVSIEKHEGIYKPGMNVCVCDIGGGTIDTQTLRILALNPLEAKEPCVGTGARIGMTDIDFKLHEYCDTLFGESFRNLPTKAVGPSSEFAYEFEVIKRGFDGKDLSKIWRLRLLPLKRQLELAGKLHDSYDFIEGEIMISGTKIGEMFEPLIERALEQVDNQIAQLKKEGLTPISMIVLAGGGGTSKYILSRFQEHCQTKLDGDIVVRRDPRAWSAVVRGGAIRGLESGMVVSRESKRAYGFVCHQAFDEAVDREEDSFECPIFGKRVRDCMDWMLQKGDTIVPGMKLTKLFYISPNDMGNLVQYWDLFQSEDKPAPTRLDNNGVKQIGRIKVDLLSNELAQKKRRVSSKKGKQEPIRIKLEVSVGSKIGVLEVAAFHGRAKVGRAQIEYGADKGRVTHGTTSLS